MSIQEDMLLNQYELMILYSKNLRRSINYSFAIMAVIGVIVFVAQFAIVYFR